MKRIARAVRHGTPTDAIAMLKETSIASGMEMDKIGTHVILIAVSKLGVVRLRLNDVMHYVLVVEKKQKQNAAMCENRHASTDLIF